MKLRKAIKKIVALGAGATMVGATIMGAMAADMSNYPAPFVKDGMFDAMIVVGDNAKASDVIGAVDVATSLQYSMKQTTTIASEGGVTQVALTGDNVEIGMPGDMLEIDEFLGENRETITASELEALRSGFISTSEGSTDYNQYLRLKDSDNDLADANVTGNIVTFGKDEDDNVGDSLYFKKGETVFIYELEFEEGLESDEVAGDLEDIEDKGLEILGQLYSIINSEVSGNQLTLELISGEILDTLDEGETKTYTIGGVDYEVEVIVISDTAVPVEVKFRINDEVTDKLSDGETDTLADGLEIGIRDVIANEAGDITPDMVEFYLGANKMVLVDDDYTAAGFNADVEINSETIDRMEVEIRAENGTNFRIDSIKFRMEAEGVDGDVFIAPGHGLREYLEEPEGMIHEGWDIVYEGLTNPGKMDIVFDPQGDEAYELEFVSVDGKVYDMPLATNEDGVFKLGTDDEKLVVEEAGASNTAAITGTLIAEDDYFVLQDEGTLSDKTSSHVMTFDSFRLSDQQLKFTDLAGGSKTISYTVAVDNAVYGTAQLTIGGSTYDVKLLNETTTAQEINHSDSTGDAQIIIDLDNDGSIDAEAVGLTTKGGAMIEFEVANLDDDANITADFGITVTTDKDNFDTVVADEVMAFDIVNRSDNEIGISTPTITGVATISLEQLEDNEDYSEGLAVYGAKVVLYDPSGTDEAEKLTVEYPLAQVGAQVFVTAGKVAATTVGAAGAVESVTLEAIEVGSAVLASEVADVAAQNLMMVGGPCANEAARKVMGLTMENCAEGFAPGKAILKLYDTGAGKVALLVAGDQPMDTRAAARVLANYDSYDLSGDEMSKTTYNFGYLWFLIMLRNMAASKLEYVLSAD